VGILAPDGGGSTRPSRHQCQNFFRPCRSCVLGCVGLLPKGAKRDEAEQKIKAAEEALKRASTAAPSRRIAGTPTRGYAATREGGPVPQ
jgi:hypothetical protein